MEGLAIGDQLVWEGNAGVRPARFTVALGRASASNVSVDYATSDDSALAWSDYNPIRDTAVIPAGKNETFVTVGVVGDHVPEPTELYSVTLSNPVGSKIGWGDGTGTIYDDDGPLPPVEISPAPPALAITAPPPPPPPAPVAQGQGQAQQQAQQQAQAAGSATSPAAGSTTGSATSAEPGPGPGPGPGQADRGAPTGTAGGTRPHL